MRLVCDVNQGECLQYGIEAHSSTVEIDVDPKLLTHDQRNFVVDNLYEGVRFPRNRALNICPPTYAGLIAAINYGIARDREKEHGATYVALTSTSTVAKGQTDLRARLIKAAIALGEGLSSRG